MSGSQKGDVTEKPKRVPKTVEHPPGYKALDVPAKVYVVHVDARIGGVKRAVLYDAKSDTTTEVLLFDDFQGWTVSEIDASTGSVKLENATAYAPLPSVVLKKKP